LEATEVYGQYMRKKGMDAGADGWTGGRVRAEGQTVDSSPERPASSSSSASHNRADVDVKSCYIYFYGYSLIVGGGN